MNTPEKKQISYKKDRRNTYGENDKSSRKSIRFRKRWTNHVNRRRGKNITKTIDLETGEVRSYRNPRKRWKKTPDDPLGYILQAKLNGRIIHVLTDLYKQDEAVLDLLHEELIRRGINQVSAKMTIRKLKAWVTCPATSYYRNARLLDNAMASSIISFLDGYRTTER